ncbi:hypothetical protein COCON_G00040600 [Conger conger]|uniref:Uncharacterized protein n=1 Tax=Conger conger TaxID=82655 RepID=A0A9Q1DTI2_CONCO|nr:hypothetical protein COCON_G00040600 [Conger conger]
MWAPVRLQCRLQLRSFRITHTDLLWLAAVRTICKTRFAVTAWTARLDWQKTDRRRGTDRLTDSIVFLISAAVAPSHPE